MTAQSAAAPSLPDLRMYGTGSLTSSSAVSGSNVTLYYSLKNYGTGAAGASVP